jgi:hypothetical protein
MPNNWRRFEVLRPLQFNDGRGEPPEWLARAQVDHSLTRSRLAIKLKIIKYLCKTMTTENPATIPGIVRNGVVVPQTGTVLREGSHVEIVLEPADVPPQLLAEIAQWDRASDEAWAMIDAWERQ